MNAASKICPVAGQEDRPPALPRDRRYASGNELAVDTGFRKVGVFGGTKGLSDAYQIQFRGCRSCQTGNA